MTKRSAATVDWEIRDIINDINELPFIKTTMYSCAGYGEAGDTTRQPGDYPDNCPTCHYPDDEAYIMIAYKSMSDEAKEFNNAMFLIAERSKPATKWIKKWKVPVVTYYFTGAVDDDKYKIRQWNRVRRLLRKYQ